MIPALGRQHSGVNADGMVAGNLDFDSQDEVAADFGALGLWLWDSGAWAQISGVNAESLLTSNATSSASAEAHRRLRRARHLDAGRRDVVAALDRQS